MSTLTKADIVDNLARELNIHRNHAKDCVESFFTIMARELIAGKNVRISSFGKFNLRDKAARPGRNPKTGEVKMVSARRVVSFNPSLKLKNKIAEGENS